MVPPSSYFSNCHRVVLNEARGPYLPLDHIEFRLRYSKHVYTIQWFSDFSIYFDRDSYRRVYASISF